MGVYLLNNLGLDGTWLTSLWEEVRASPVASGAVWGLGSATGTGDAACVWYCLPSLSPPAPKGRRDQTKLVLMRNVVESCGLLLDYCCQIPSLQGKPSQEHEGCRG